MKAVEETKKENVLLSYDKALLKKYGLDKLFEFGYEGVISRLEDAGLIRIEKKD